MHHLLGHRHVQPVQLEGTLHLQDLLPVLIVLLGNTVLALLQLLVQVVLWGHIQILGILHVQIVLQGDTQVPLGHRLAPIVRVVSIIVGLHRCYVMNVLLECIQALDAVIVLNVGLEPIILTPDKETALIVLVESIALPLGKYQSQLV